MAEKSTKPKKELIAEKEAPSGFLATVERVGNAVPHPAIIFLILIAIVIVLSAIFGMLGTSVSYEGYDEAVGDIDEMLSQLERRAPGDSVTLTLWRNGQTRKQAVVLGAGE